MPTSSKVDCVTLRRLSTDPKQGELSETEEDSSCAPDHHARFPQPMSSSSPLLPSPPSSSIVTATAGGAGSGSGCAVHIHWKLLVVLCGLGNIFEKTPDTNCSTELAVAFDGGRGTVVGVQMGLKRVNVRGSFLE
ncbi:unnamed protein product [Boreogadus saida]